MKTYIREVEEEVMKEGPKKVYDKYYTLLEQTRDKIEKEVIRYKLFIISACYLYPLMNTLKESVT